MNYHRFPPVSLIMLMGILLVACSEPGNEDNPGETVRSSTASGDTPIEINAPAGVYQHDPNHTTLSFSVNHLGLSHYIVEFSDYETRLKLTPDNLENSSITITVQADSVDTDYPGDYKAGHQDSPFNTWDEALARSEKFFNADKYPEIRFESTDVNQVAPSTLRITGDLTMLGHTQPIELFAEIVGNMAEHPMTGTGAIGFSAVGSFQRSDFGMDAYIEPGFVGDTVTIRFDGEFLQQHEQPEPQQT